jgi:amidase
MIANVTGQPSMSPPLHWTTDDLPMGLLFTGARTATMPCVSARRTTERAVPWSDRIAPNAIPREGADRGTTSFT